MARKKKEGEEQLNLEDLYLSRSLDSLSFTNENKILIVEDWVPIMDYEDYYQISSFGRVKSLKRFAGNWTTKEMILQHSNGKYPQINLKVNNSLDRRLVHRLTALHFVENPNNFDIVHHIDRNPRNPMAINLKWVTQSQNCRDSYACGNKSQKGEDNNQAKLTKEIVKEIRLYYLENNHLSYKEVGGKFGISGGHVKDIVTYKSWK
jgi:hypothetical protein